MREGETPVLHTAHISQMCCAVNSEAYWAAQRQQCALNTHTYALSRPGVIAPLEGFSAVAVSHTLTYSCEHTIIAYFDPHAQTLARLRTDAPLSLQFTSPSDPWVFWKRPQAHVKLFVAHLGQWNASSTAINPSTDEWTGRRNVIDISVFWFTSTNLISLEHQQTLQILDKTQFWTFQLTSERSRVLRQRTLSSFLSCSNALFAQENFLSA